MMLVASISMGIALGLFGLLFWLLFRPLPQGRNAAEFAARLELEELFPLHCRHFPQIRRALSSEDEVFLQRRSSRRTYESWLANRRRAVRSFLAGLRQDFVRLEQLARAVAALSPQVNRAREMEQFWLSLRFRMLYRLVALRIQIGSIPLPEMTRLTQLVGSFAARIEAGIAALEESSVSNLRTTFSV